MWRHVLLFLFLLLGAILIQAPATVWNSWIQGASDGKLALLDARGSLWHGAAQVAIRDSESGEQRPLTPVSWQWRPLDLVRARVVWSFSVAGLPPFTLAASPGGVAANSVSLQLPVGAVLSQVPNAVAQAGWHGDFSLSSDQWQCSWRGSCGGHAELFWRGAASDLFPNRNFGNYRLVVDGADNVMKLKLDTLSGEIVLNATGEVSPRGAALQGSVEGDPAFVGRLPDIANRWVQRTNQPGRMLFNFDNRGAAK